MAIFAALTLSLQILNISLVQFRNYSSRDFVFNEKVSGIYGLNGTGKTNLLDAVHYLCFTRSYFTRQDSQAVQSGQSGFRIEGTVMLHGQPEQAVCVFRENGRKEFSINGSAYSKLSDHIGRYPCVVIAPDDVQLITGTSDGRRTFLDMLLCQLDHVYLQWLITHNRVLQQRNALLKSLAPGQQPEIQLLETLDEQLATVGDPLFRKRQEFLLSFLPKVKQLYTGIAGHYEDLQLSYQSELFESGLADLLRRNRVRDIATQRTCSGIHRDDLEFNLGSRQFKTTASQGQRKSLLFALKLAEMEVLQEEKKFAPVLLLDDVFEKLDEERITSLLHRVCLENDGQVLITDTSGERLEKKLTELGMPFGLITP